MTQRSRAWFSICLFAGAIFLLLPAAAAAQPTALGRSDSRVEIHLEYVRPSFDSSVRLDSAELGIGTEIDLERELGLDETGSGARAELLFRLGRRNRLTLDYTAFDRSGSRTITESIQFGDAIYTASAEVDSTLDSRWLAAGWRFAFVAEPQAEVGFSLNVAWIEIEASLSGLATLGDGPPLPIEESGQVDGPVPMLGLHGSFWLGDRVRLSGAARYLDIDDLDGWSGSALDYGAQVEWFLLERLALSAGYGGNQIEAESSEAGTLGHADLAYDGFRAGLTVRF